MKTKQLFFGLFALALIGALAFVWLSSSGITQTPAITVRTIEGVDIKLTDLRGRPVLVTFWATTCSSCIKEIPHLTELYREFSPRGLEMIAIAMAYDPPNHVLAMRDARAIPYPIALDIEGTAARAFGNVRLTPTSFLIRPDGRIVQHNTGELDLADVHGQIRSLLGT